MDIAKFNKELAYKVAKANGLEKNNKTREAIKEWVDVTEMVLKFSKAQKLDFAFRSMLIERVEKIIDHIKILKLKLAGYKEEIVSKSEDVLEKRFIPESEPQEIYKPKAHTSSTNEAIDDISLEKKEITVIEDSEFKKLPKGFQEIEAPKEFEIITPHDKEHIKNLLDQEFKREKDIDLPNQKIKLDKPVNKNIILCFACGTELPSNTRNCPNCGTDLKK